MELFDDAPLFLQKHPVVGMLFGITGSALHWVNILSPFLSFLGLIIGVGIGAITLHLKLMEWKQKRKEQENEYK